jgi:dTDP-4-dehydrorhamnose 3,5-epimerase
VKTYPTPLAGLCVVQHTPISDHRGAFARIFCTHELSEILDSKQIIQINHSLTKSRGAVRGMHFQYPPYMEIKLVTCLKGEVFDVAVDIRQNSPTYLKWHAEILNPENNKTMVIPEGFAHGFQTLTQDCEMLYLHTCAYNPEAEGGLNPSDPALGIDWPLAFTEISQKDSDQTFIDSEFKGVSL